MGVELIGEILIYHKKSWHKLLNMWISNPALKYSREVNTARKFEFEMLRLHVLYESN